jgi:hypothetical protein
MARKARRLGLILLLLVALVIPFQRVEAAEAGPRADADADDDDGPDVSYMPDIQDLKSINIPR